MVAVGYTLSFPKNPTILNPTPPCSRLLERFTSWFGLRLAFHGGSGTILATDWKMMEWLKGVGSDRGGSYFKERSMRGVEIETDSGGEDVLDASAAQGKVSQEHFVIMVNGLVGSSTDWRYVAKQFLKRLPDKVIVHCSECNFSKLTFDGVDLMGERLAQEVLVVIRHRPEVRKISFVAHSLGGLVARYVVARLYEHPPKLNITSLSGSSIGEDLVNFFFPRRYFLTSDFHFRTCSYI